jgi:hypothetical protein
MSYYILPKVNNQVVIEPNENKYEIKPYVSQSLLHYFNNIKSQINHMCLDINDFSSNNFNELIKIVHPYEYIFSKVSGSKYSVSKLKPNTNIFYDFFEMFNSLLPFELYKNNISSLHISDSGCDTIDCFEMLRENFNDNNDYINNTVNYDFSNNKKYDFLVFNLNFNSLNDYFIKLLHYLMLIFNNQQLNGSCVIKIDNLFYKPVIDFMYILSSLYEKVYIYKPNTSNVTTFEKYIICKNYQTNLLNTNLINENFNALQLFIENLQYNSIHSFLNFEIPYYFLLKIDDVNIITGQQQIESLDLIINILKNKNRDEKFETLKKNNILKSIMWCEKYKIPCNKFAEKVNIFLPINKTSEEIN